MIEIENAKYLRVMKMAQIDLQYADDVCSKLSKKTLDRLTKVGFDRRLIAPILNKASYMKNGINDENVNVILDDQNAIIAMMRKYCE